MGNAHWQRTTWGYVVVDERSANMLTEAQNIIPHIRIRPTQGSWSTAVGASAGTHGGGGAVDISTRGLSEDEKQLVTLTLRRVGWFASIRREWEGPWPEHIHAVAVGCDSLSPAARDQVDDYMVGLNGLANNGPDLGPRQFVGVTWERYKEDPVITNADVDRIAEAAAAKVEPKIPTAADVARAVWTFVPKSRADMFNPHRMLRWLYGKGEALEDYLTALPDDEQPPATDG